MQLKGAGEVSVELHESLYVRGMLQVVDALRTCVRCGVVRGEEFLPCSVRDCNTVVKAIAQPDTELETGVHGMFARYRMVNRLLLQSVTA